MPQTNPFHAIVPRKLTDEELAMAIRLNLEAELDAINLYAAHILATDNEEAKAIIRHVMDEEKEHATLFTELLYRLDPDYRKHAQEATAKFQLIISGASHEAVEAAGEGAQAPAAAHQEPTALTVGRMRRTP
jgi:uncharacterized protein